MKVEEKFLEEAKQMIDNNEMSLYERFLSEFNYNKWSKDSYNHLLDQCAADFSHRYKSECYKLIRKEIKTLREDNYKNFILSLDHSLCMVLHRMLAENIINNEYVEAQMYDYMDAETYLDYVDTVGKDFFEEFNEITDKLYDELLEEKFDDILENYVNKIKELNIEEEIEKTKNYLVYELYKIDKPVYIEK